jgi:hypothetical protein
MNLSEYINFLYGNAFLRNSSIRVMTGIMATVTLGALAVGIWRKVRGGGQSAPPSQQRKAA